MWHSSTLELHGVKGFIRVDNPRHRINGNPFSRLFLGISSIQKKIVEFTLKSNILV